MKKTLAVCAATVLLSGCAGTGVVSALGGGSGLPGQVLGLPGTTAAQLVNAEIADISSIVQAIQALKALLDGIVVPALPTLPAMPVPPVITPPAPTTPGGPVVTPSRR